jgi:hypothetical protein
MIDIDIKKKLYRKWSNMCQRCNNPNTSGFEYYGGNGIIMCEEWDDFENFHQWSLANGYKEGLVLSRKKNTDDFTPDTCEWITDQEHRAKRGILKQVITITYNNNIVTLSELSKITGIKRETLKSRWKRGYQGEDLLRKVNKGLKLYSKVS